MAKVVRLVLGTDHTFKMVNLLGSGSGAFPTDAAGTANDRSIATVQPGGDGSNAFPSIIIPGFDSFQNFKLSSFSKWKVALNRVKTRTGRARIICLGDSTAIGTGGGSSGTHGLVGGFSKGYVAKLAAGLAAFYPTSFNSFFGDQNVITGGATTLPLYDARITEGANWGLGASAALGGDMIKYTTGAANNFTFTPAGEFDTITIWYFTQTGNGAATVNVDGGASLGTINFGATNFQMKSVTYSVTKGAHTINIVPSNNGSFSIAGIITQDSTTPAVDFIQAGSYGGIAANFASSANVWGPVPMVGKLAPDLTLINCTINDSNVQTSLSAYSTSLQTAITNAKLSGDVMLMVGPPSNTAQATNGTLATYIAAMKTLALSNNLSLFDLTKRTNWGSYAVANAVYPYFDNNHPGATGYVDIAAGLASGLVMIE